MFKNGSCADDIFRSMKQHLVANQTEEQHGFDKLAQAIDYLSLAAELFDKAGMTEQAIEITQVIGGLHD